MNDEIKIEQKKNKSGFAIFLLCIAFLLLGAGGMYYLINSKQLATESNSNNTTNQPKTINQNSLLVKELISRLDYNTDCGVNDILYKNSTTTLENLDQTYLNALVAKQANGKKITGVISFTKQEFDDSAKILFGENTILPSTNINEICPAITYDIANQRYIGSQTQCPKATCNFENQRHIVKAEKDGNNLYIYVAVAKIDTASRKVSNINDPNSVIQDIDINTFDISKDYEKVNNYKYTFIYDEMNLNYIFKSIELVK